jgi:hypothetical protein
MLPSSPIYQTELQVSPLFISWLISLGVPTYPVRFNHPRSGMELHGFQPSSLFLFHPVWESERSLVTAST